MSTSEEPPRAGYEEPMGIDSALWTWGLRSGLALCWPGNVTSPIQTQATAGAPCIGVFA
jgi:hypothetical protein